MTRVHIICEGQTEETFVNEVLRPHLMQGFQVLPIASLLGKPGMKGGGVTTSRMVSDIRLRLLGDWDAWCTNFFDFYGLAGTFAGLEAASYKKVTAEKAMAVEMALTEKLLQLTGNNALRRFIPYIQMYEFEGLLFSNPAMLAAAFYEPELEDDFSAIRNGFPTPEDINNDRETAPSKRILKLMPHYEKPLYGSLAAIEIGLARIRLACPRFGEWLGKLEKLQSLP